MNWSKKISEADRNHLKLIWNIFKTADVSPKVEADFVAYANRLIAEGKLQEVEKLVKFLNSKKWEGAGLSDELENHLKGLSKQVEINYKEDITDGLASYLDVESQGLSSETKDVQMKSFLNELVRINNCEYERPEIKEKFQKVIKEKTMMRKTVLENQKMMTYIDNYTSKQKGKMKLHIVDFFIYEGEDILVISLISRELRVNFFFSH